MRFVELTEVYHIADNIGHSCEGTLKKKFNAEEIFKISSLFAHTSKGVTNSSLVEFNNGKTVHIEETPEEIFALIKASPKL
jgi:hypothetical protein